MHHALDASVSHNATRKCSLKVALPELTLQLTLARPEPYIYNYKAHTKMRAAPEKHAHKMHTHTHAIRILYAHKRAEMHLSCIFVRNKVQPYARDKVEKRSNARTSTLALPASPASICGITSHHHQPASRASSTQHHQPKLIESEIIKSHKSGALRSSVICAQTTQQPKNAPHPQTPSFGGLSCETTGESTVVHFPTTNFERSAKRPNVSYNLSWSPNKPANNCPFSLSQGTSFAGGSC